MRGRVFAVLLVVSLLFIVAVQTGEAAWPDDAFVAGTVVDGEGEPFMGVNVTAQNVTTGEEFSTTTDVNGTFNLTLPLGTYNLTASYPNFTSNITYEMMGVNVNITGLDFTLNEILGTVEGFITDGQAPIINATAYLVNDEFNYSANSTAPFGKFVMTGIQPGTYVAHAEKEGYNTDHYELPVVVVRGETADVNFTLEQPPATLFGQVMFGTKGLAGVTVQISSGESSKSTITDNDGFYRITDISAGTYIITFSKQDYFQQQFEITFSPSQIENLDIAMEKETGAGEGFIPGFDLPHSLMLVGLILALITLVFALFVRMRVEKRPELLEKEEIEEEGGE
jgi:hypothetical protein